MVTFFGRHGMKTALTDAATRRGMFDGIIVGVGVMTLVFVGNVVVPVADQNSPVKYAVAWLLLALVGVLFVVIGARGRRLVSTASAGARAGAVAGFVIAAMFVLTFVIMDNLFFATIIQQPGKIGSTRASLNATLVPITIFFLSVTSLGGAVLGRFGGLIVGNRIAGTGARRDG